MSKQDNVQAIVGRHPVLEALNSGRVIDKILLYKEASGSAKKIMGRARDRGVPVQFVQQAALERLAGGRPHQGVAAIVAAYEPVTLDELFRASAQREEAPFVVLLDELQDPHNVGAIIRSADGAGAHGVIIPSRRAAGLTETVVKASAGAIEYVPVARIGNVASTVEDLKKRGLWVIGLDMDGELYSDVDLTGPIALVVGGEGRGLSRLVQKRCDRLVSIPMAGQVDSLNASNAAAVLLYEVRRQRMEAERRGER